MKKVALILVFSLLCCFTPGAQETQDFIDNWLKDFSALTEPKNTGLTVFPILELSPGGKRSSIGNAFTGLANDISFLEANPAASSILEITELTFFHRNLISDISLDALFFTQRLRNFGYGLGAKFLHFEFTALDSQGNQIASATPAEILVTANVSYNFFANFNFTGIAAGINVKLAYRGVPPELYRHVLDPDEHAQDLVGVLFDVGLLSRFNFLKIYSGRDKNFSVGLTVLNLGPLIRNESPPTEIRLGIAYKPLSFFTISSDINYMMNLANIEKSEGLGFATGIDIHFVEFFGIQGGMEWRGSSPRFSFGADINLEPVSFHIAYTLSLGTSLSTVDNFSIGASLNFGDEGRAEIQRQVDDIYVRALLALSEGDYQEVIDLCEQIVDPVTGLDPSFTPAQETRLLAITSIEREQQLIEFERNREDVSPVTEPE